MQGSSHVHGYLYLPVLKYIFRGTSLYFEHLSLCTWYLNASELKIPQQVPYYLLLHVICIYIFDLTFYIKYIG